jgi:hypothetical protein
MIDLDKIGFNILEKDGHLEVVGGMTLTVQVRISSLAPDKEAMIGHARKRIREKIWEMAYGHLAKPVKDLSDLMQNQPPLIEDQDQEFVTTVDDAVQRLKVAVGEA